MCYDYRMTRRGLLSLIARGAALCSVGAGSIFSFRSRNYSISDFYISSQYPEQLFASTADFWSYHYDLVGDKANHNFLESRRLLSKRSYLLEDQKTVVVEQVFRSKADYLMREQVKNLLKQHNKANVGVLHIKQEIKVS